MAETANPRVFISYAHEGNLSQQVQDLADWLSDQGVEVITDHPYVNRPPEQGWRAWMQHNIEDADMVLIVCTKLYKDLFEKRIQPGDKGRGVSWESAIITDDLYQGYLQNTRFYPILPDSGEHQHVPRVLRDWHNGHRFPSGNERILKLIYGEIAPLEAQKPTLDLSNRELVGASDRLITPKDKKKIVGRKQEIKKIVKFLKGKEQSAVVTGIGGIGKTEVCKAALKKWLSSKPETRCFWAQLSDQASASELLNVLGKSVGLSNEQLATITNLSQLHTYLPQGLYYLDNLESLVEEQAGRDLVRDLHQINGLRWLTSSRVGLEEFELSINIERLDTEAGCELFLRHWNGRTEPDANDLAKFIDKQLGGHALSIVLLARLGRTNDLSALIEKWDEKGTELAKHRHSDNRLKNLDISFALTQALLAQTQGALELWQFAALFNGLVPDQAIQSWSAIYQKSHPTYADDALDALLDHHLLTSEPNGYSMLPPVARYALQPSKDPQDSETSFNWQQSRTLAYQHFIKLSKHASDIASSEEALLARQATLEQLKAIALFIEKDLTLQTEDTDHLLIKILHSQLHNVYGVDPITGPRILAITTKVLKDGLSSHRLGYLESRLGNVEAARGHYDEAIELYEKEQAKLGRANALQALGDLERRLGNVEAARGHYDEAIELYEKEQDQLGRANALQALGDLESRLGNVEAARGHYDEAIELYEKEQDQLGRANVLLMLGILLRDESEPKQALEIYQEALELYQAEQVPMGTANTLAEILRCQYALEQLSQETLETLAREALGAAIASNLDSVIGYVMQALLKVCDNSETKLKTLLEKLTQD